MVMRIAVIADTHIATGSARTLPAEAWGRIEGADLVLHAGDVTSPDFLDQLTNRSRGDVLAVLGNNDDVGLSHLPERIEREVGGVRVAMVHDSGSRKGRPARMRRWFPDADVVVFGHSHEPVNEPGADGQWLLNPGSPTQRRRQPLHSMAVMEAGGGRFEARIERW